MTKFIPSVGNFALLFITELSHPSLALILSFIITFLAVKICFFAPPQIDYLVKEAYIHISIIMVLYGMRGERL